ncbi:hypothetical protein TNCV_1202091 [Trichonephila clavipes]|nr:hypothetical protein TNCV_1202091 [Trichonephila clavipes]
MIVQFRNEKVSNRGSIPITIDCNVVASIGFEEGFHQPIKTHQTVESLPEPDDIGNLVEEVVDLARQINPEVDRPCSKDTNEFENEDFRKTPNQESENEFVTLQYTKQRWWLEADEDLGPRAY